MTDRRVAPFSDNILVRTTDSIYAKPSGDEVRTGTVLAYGPGRYENGIFVKPPVSIGNTIAFSPFGGIKIQLDGEYLLLLSSRDIFAKITLENTNDD